MPKLSQNPYLKIVNSLLIVLILLIGSVFNSSIAQTKNPAHHTISIKKVSDNIFDVICNVKIDKPWHIYSMTMPPTEEVSAVLSNLKIETTPNIALEGKLIEQAKVISFIEKSLNNTELRYIEDKATYIQRIKVLGSIKEVKGTFEYMTCDDKQCLQPQYEDFKIPLKVDLTKKTEVKEEVKIDKTPAVNQKESIPTPNDTLSKPTIENKQKDTSAKSIIKSETNNPNQSVKNASLWSIFWGGMLGGLLALFTPCVFPLIPLTVSFFTKQSKTRQKGIFNASLYGLSIIVIYILLGFLVTRLFGAETLNGLASNAFFNLAFFIIFVIFGFSFLGAFEITLPGSWSTKTDEMSDKGGLIGIFFMAFTLALVSFSCTGPIVGQLLVLAAINGQVLGPIVGMFGFSLALAIPFTLFAIFPSWLNGLPKSGGWLNSVKVVLGLLELAAALKFLSAVDLAYHWDFLKREYFIALWIAIFGLMGLYLIGKIKFSHDTDLPFLSVPRAVFAIIVFAFTLYLIPGLWGAPLNLLSGLAPPNGYTEGLWTQTAPFSGGSATTITSNKKYEKLFHCPHNLDCFFDYDQALEESKKQNKPLFIDFTGHACVNCRKMENTVWAKPEVLKRLSHDFVVVSLYVDDKTPLPENEQFKSKVSGRMVTTLGEKWSDMQVSKYNSSSQPQYFVLGHDESILSGPTSYDPDEQIFINFLDKGKNALSKK